MPGGSTIGAMTDHRSDTHDALLDVAEQLFGEKGYAAVGIREIAEL